MKHWIRWCVVVLGLLVSGTALRAQGYTGITGLVHIPTAEMAKEGDVRAEALMETLPPEQQEIADQINRRTEFKVLRTNYNLY